MSGSVLYDDGRVMLDEDALTLRHYYFPLGTSKVIRYAEIRAVHARVMGWLNGKGRLWGTGSFRYWLPLDLGRPRRDTLVVLDLGSRLCPAFTPDDPPRVLALLSSRTGR